MEHKDNLDRFLDHALSSLNDATPREGLEQRILANLAANKTRRSSWRWLWVAVPAAAVILLAVLLVPKPSHNQDTNVPNPSPEITRPVPPLEAGSGPMQDQPKRATTARIRRSPKVRAEVAAKAQVNAEPRLATFPSPDNGEQQARLLLQFVRQHPDMAQQWLKEQQEFRAMVARNQQDPLQFRSEEQ
jgi:hypothetical protein